MMSVRSLVTAMAAVLFLAVQIAHAQSSIGDDITSTTAPLSSGQQQVVEDFVKYWVDQMVNTDDRLEIVQARKRLTGRISNGSIIFKTYYSRTVSENLKPLMENQDDPAIRVNAAIICSYLIDPAAADLAIIGLQDENPAVRYWAARAVTTLAEKMPPSDQRNMFAALAKAFKDEPDANVQQQMLAGVVELDIPQAHTMAVDVLKKRAAFHHDNPKTSMQGDFDIINRFNLKLVLNNVNADPATIKPLMTVAYRYLDVTCSRSIDAKNDPQVLSDYQKQINNFNGFLRWAMSELAPSVNVPASVPSNANELNLFVAEWKHTLTAKPISIPVAELEFAKAEN